MSAIKAFFKKKKADAKFKLAGSGQTLGDAHSQPSRPQPAPSRREERQHPSQSAQQAGAAALNRINKDQHDEDFRKSRQRAMIKEQARRELEEEKKIEEEISRIKDVYGEKPVEDMVGPSQLEGVYYKCALIGDDVYTKDIMKEKIREFLYSQLEEERALTAALIIHTCNSPREKVAVCVETLCKYIDNILKNPTEEKFRKIRRSNKAFQERVASMEGSNDFLLGCGFELKELSGQDGHEEPYLVFPEEKLGDLELLSAMKDCLLSAEPVTAELSRDTTVLTPTAGPQPPPVLPQAFFNITKEEIKKEQQIKSEVVERESMLRTKAMREKEEIKARRKYKFCLIRIRFPDNYMVQGTFGVYESLAAVMEWVTDCLETPLPFQLNDSVTGAKLEESDVTLIELGLVPTAVIAFAWDQEIAAEIAAAGTIPTFLRTDLLGSCSH